jgi:hypothetical protein
MENALYDNIKTYINDKIKELYGSEEIVDIFSKLKMKNEFMHSLEHVFQVAEEISTTYPLTRLFGYVIEGSEYQQIFDQFVQVMHNMIIKMTTATKIEYENEGDAWLFGNYNQGSYNFKEEREQHLIKISKKFKKVNSDKTFNKYLKYDTKKMSKRSGKNKQLH